MIRLKCVIKSAFLGLVTGPLYILTAMFLDDVLGFKSPILLIVTVFGAISLIFITIARGEKRQIIVVSTILLLLLATYSIFFFSELVVIGPKGEIIPFTYLIANFRYEGETIGSWDQAEWNFYKPECYSEFYAKKLKGRSLEVSAFYYGYSGNPFHSVPKHLFTKLSCGITDSKTAYEGYKKLLSNFGFSIEDGLDNFTAKNESTVVYCQLDGDFIMVVKVDRGEEYLLNRIKIMKGRF